MKPLVTFNRPDGVSFSVALDVVPRVGDEVAWEDGLLFRVRSVRWEAVGIVASAQDVTVELEVLR